MADKRIQQYPEKVAPSTSDYLLVADAEDVDVNGYLKYKKVKISSLDNIVITNAEDITLTAINTLISTNALVIGRFYRITNSASGVNPILVQAVALNVLSDIGISSVNGTVYNYDISTDTVSVPYAGVYVPYTGATTNVDLGEYQIKVGQLELDQTPTGTFGVGKIRWNDTDGTPEVMLKGANVTLQIGQEQLARVVNKTNTNLTEAGYQVVRISGAQGQRLKVGLAQANSTSTCKDTLGLVTENISNNAEGFITTSGLVRNINTTGSLQGETWADGDRLYLSANVAGGITNVEPSAPNIVIVLGYVVYAHANQGSIYVSVEGAKALHELFDVSIPTPTNNNVLVYESSTGLWKDKSISTILGFTPIANNATVGGELSGTLPNPSLVTSAVTGKALTGLSVSGSAVVSTDSILTGIGKLQNQINAVVGSVNFQGVWNASTNSPSLASGVGTKGYYYVVSVPGSTNLDGITDWKLGDWAIYDGTAWQKVDNTDAVVSVNGYTGIVTLAKADIGLGNVENTALSTWAGSTNITTLGTISSGVWNGTAIGDTYISSASTWNAKIGGSGTTGKLAKFTSSGAVGDSIVSESGGVINTLGSSTWNPVDNALETLRIYRGNTAPFLAQSTFIDTSGGNTNIRNNSTDSARTINLSFSIDGTSNYTTKLSLSNTELITFGATDTGEAHIFGGSARVNGSLLTTGSISTTTSNINVGNGTAVENVLVVNALTYSGVRFARGGVNKWAMFNNNAGSNFFDIYNYDTATTSLSISPTNQIITNVASNTGEHFIIGGSARVNGTFGVGVTASSWGAGYQVIQVSNTSLFGSSSLDLNLGSNMYLDNVGYKYISNGFASLYNQYLGKHYWSTASSGTAGNAITFTQAMTLDASGNLGIGTTSPSTPLDIVSNSGASALNIRTRVNNDFGILSFSNYAGTQTISEIYIHRTGDNVGSLIFTTNNGSSATERMRIISSGNVGIGTTSPTQKLDVNGNIALSFNGESLIVNDQRDTDSISIRGAANINFHTFNGSSYVERMRITSSGNVGIGTTSPSSYSFNDPAFLVVANTSGNSTLSIVSSTTGIGYLAFADGTTGTDRYSGSIFYSHSTNTMSFKTAGSDRLEISSTGAATFSSSVTSNSYINSLGRTTSHGFRLPDWQIYNTSGGALAFNNYTTDFLTIAAGGSATFSSSVTAGGSVGVGGTNTDSLLTINGTAGTSHERFREGSTTVGFIGGANGIVSGHNGKLALRAEAGLVLSGQGNAADFVISNTGAATFSSSVTVGASTNGRLGVRGTTNDSSAYAFEATNSSGSTLFIVRNDNVTSVDGKFLIGTFTPGASKLSVVGLPTSASGLSTGDVWNDSGTLKIV